MADKSINDLPAVESLADDGLLPVYQDGGAKRLTGAQLSQYAGDAAVDAVTEQAEEITKAASKTATEAATAAASSASAAAGSAAAAKANADAVDPDEINSRIALKADNLYFDEDTKLLYLTSGGEIIGDGIKVSVGGSGGGGGGSDNNAVLTLSNTTGWIFKSIAAGASCSLSVSWSSLEDGLATGGGVLKVTVNGAQKLTQQVAQGAVTVDVGAYLSPGTNAVKINVSDVYGNSRTLSFSITAVALSLSSSFDASVPYTGAIAYPYTPTGTAAKIMHFKLDGVELETVTVTASGRQQTYTIPAQTHGSHSLEVWFTATVDGESVSSNVLRYDLICTAEGSTTPIIASAWQQATAEQYSTLAIPYIVYNPSGLTAEITLKVGSTVLKTLTVDRTEQVWSYRADEVGALSLSIVCGSVSKTFVTTVTESTVNVEAETADLALHLTASGRSNTEANKASWSYGNIAASLTGFNWTSDGWVTDADGITALRVAGDARVTIPLQIFAQDFRTTGKTIELEFATRDVMDYDATVISCLSGGRGIKVTAQKASLTSEQSEVSTQYKEDEHVRLAFVVEKRAENRLILVYINGILSGAVQYPTDDDFSQSSPVGISIGSNACTTDIYGIRVYNNSLTRYQVLNNWIADSQAIDDLLARYQRNKIYDDYGQIVIDDLPQDLPYLILEGPELPQYKGDKKTVSGSFTDPTDSSRNFTFTGASINVQGTSSQYYARKNYKVTFKGGFVVDGVTAAKYALRPGAIPVDTFTFKADVASSEGANNVELVRLYNDACPYQTPPQEANSAVRQGIDGFPMVIFWRHGDETTFLGKYNFNNDKGTPEVYGFAEGDESWEILNNTSDRVLWKSADFTGDWTGDFEGRYPDGNTDTTKLAALAAWLASTDQSAVTSDADKAARLAKFKSELPDHLELQSALFYYLFTELFLMVDSRAKNAFPSHLGTDKWCWLPYDFDTAIGTNNEGALVFGYALEDIDQVGTADVFNGQNSVMWVNLRQAYGPEIAAMYQSLRSTGKLSYALVEEMFESHQAKWPEAIFNEDAYFKYLQPLIEDGTSAYLSMLQGSKAEQRKWWLYNRFRYLDAKYNAGDALTDTITLRGYAKDNISVTPYADIYASVKYGSYLVQKRALRGSSYVLECPLDNVNDTEIYVYSASQLKAIGDLSGLKVGYAEFSLATRLQSLKLGDSTESYSNPNLTELYLGNNRLLTTLDVRNCPNLTMAVDVSGCTGLEHAYFDGTAITGLTLPNGGVLKTLHLPATVTNLTVRNQGGITDFSMPSYGAITTLRVENSPAIPAKDILSAMAANSRVRLLGVSWSFETAADILSLLDTLDTMRGLDEQGNNVDKAQVSGTVSTANITGAQLADIHSRYPDLTVVYQHITSQLKFYNGSTLLQTVDVADGGDGAYTGSTPTKASTAQYSYTFAGWALTDGGPVDANALKAVTADRNVYAAFTATVRTYTVRFYNGSTLLQTSSNIPYGGSASYTGTTPTKEGDYEFTGWSPSPSNITGDTNCYAQFRFTGLPGIAWTQSNIISGNFYGVDFGDNLWVAAGSTGMYYSTDGKNWTQSNITEDVSANNLVHANGLWVVGCSSMYYSTDGKNWTAGTMLSGSFKNPDTVAFANNLWVGYSQGGRGMYYSTDGKNWTQSNIISGNFYGVDFGDNLWVAAGSTGMYYSTDGKNWTQSNVASSFSGVAYADGLWVAGSNNGNGIYYSTDGKNWTQSNITSGRYNYFHKSNGLWVVASNNGNGIYYSTDGKNWTPSNITSGRYSPPVRGGELWVVGSRTADGLKYSADGKSWTQSSNIVNGRFTMVAFADDLWVAACSDDKGLYYSE